MNMINGSFGETVNIWNGIVNVGWNDVSFHGSDQIPTPNIDALAYSGIILNSHYVMPTCTPSRASLMTGKYPIRLGMQGAPLNPTIKGGLPEGKILPQYLKDLGYVTRAIGKWHLGFHKKELTPTFRGFDSHLGYWNGHIGYYDIILDYGDIGAGYDLRSNLTTAWEHAGRYATDVFTEEAERLILEHDAGRPLFLYLAHQAAVPLPGAPGRCSSTWRTRPLFLYLAHQAAVPLPGAPGRCSSTWRTRPLFLYLAHQAAVPLPGAPGRCSSTWRTRPLFLYLAHQAAHAGAASRWLDAPQQVVNKFLHISDPDRRVLAGVLWKLDESVGRVVSALERRGMLENSIVVFLSDNGAPADVVGQPNWSSNYPLRGLKGSLWEGGVRGSALVWSPLLQSSPRVSNQLMHISDWLPTLYAAAGGDATDLPADLDGLDLWEALTSNGDWPRTEVLINRNDEDGVAAVRVGDWKLVRGPVPSSGYYGASGSEDARYTPPYDPQQVADSAAGRAVSSVAGAPSTSEDMLRLRAAATVSCPGRPAAPACSPQTGEEAEALCVFDVARDPCEAAASDPSGEVLALLLARLGALSAAMLPVQHWPLEPDLVRPSRWNNTWVPWTDCLADPADVACNVVT